MNYIEITEHSTSSLSMWLGSLVENSLTSIGIPLSFVIYAKLAVFIIIAIFVITALQFGVRALISFLIKKINFTTDKNILDYVVDNKIPHYVALLAPYTFIRNFIPIMFSDFPGWISPAIKIADIYLVLMIIWMMLAIIKSFINVLQERPAFAHKPIRSYVQVISIILYSLGGIVMFAIITSQSPGVILAGLGAASAVTMLVFQDSIKGFVGSIQMTINNMVELNDWITVDKHNADGSVEEINLTTVKVRNFDNTVTTVPTYSLISDSFQNWKPMQLGGGRRLKKSLFIKQGSIRFMKEEELDRYREIECLKKAIETRVDKYKTLDKKFIDGGTPVTNNDLYMAYAQDYLNNHPNLNKKMTTMFRQGAPTATGLPLEIYVFTDTVVWVDYERISSEIINHLIAMVEFFDLKLFEVLSDSSKKI